MSGRTAAVAGLLLGGAACGPARVDAAEPPPSILFMSGAVEEKAFGNPNPYALRMVLPDARLQTKLKEWGYTWAADFFSTGMQWENLTNFNAVVMLDFPCIERQPKVKDDIRRVEGLLCRYVESGGGLFLTGHTEANQWSLERNVEELNRFLKPWGAFVPLEQVDEQNPALCQAKPYRDSISRLAWTGNVTRHPLTEGVRGFLYPADDGGMCYYTHPVRVNRKWDVLLRASKTARTATVAVGGNEAGPGGRRPGSIASEPPLLAVRNAGAGRVVLWPTIPSITIIDGYHAFWGHGLAMISSDKAHPSEGERLVGNLLAWLVEPSRGRFGGYVPPPKQEAKEPGLHRISWDTIRPSGRQYPNRYKGLIGMRSALSTGSDSPAAMIAAAKAAGYDFAAFGDELVDLTADELERMRTVCESACSDRFQAFAGFTYKDMSGNSWQVFGNALHWPRDDWWHDRKAGTLVNNNVVFRGYQFNPVLMVHPNLNPERPWFQGNFKGMAVYTYNGNKCVDDAHEVYGRLQNDDYQLWPAVVHAVRSVGEVKAAAAAAMPQSYVQWHELSDVLSAYSGLVPMHKGKYVFLWPQFVGNGPLVEALTVINFGTSDLTIPENDRFRVHARVVSAVGLREISIVDGSRLWRRFLLSGTNQWEQVIDGFHDRNHHFMLEAVDVNGGTARTAAVGTSVQELNVPRCSDNFNTFHAGKFRAQNVFPVRGLENYFGSRAGDFSFFPVIPGAMETERYAVDQRLSRVSRFGFVKTDVLHDFYAPSASPNWNKNDVPELAQPQTGLKGKVVTTLFTPWSDGTYVCLVEGNFEALRDMDVPSGNAQVYQVPWLEESDGVVAGRTNRTSGTTLLRERRASWSGTSDDLEYVANIGAFTGARALIPLDTRLTVCALRGGPADRPSASLLARLPLPANKKILAGETLSYRYLAVWTAMNDPSDNSYVETLLDTMGFRGAAAYRVEPVAGSVISTRFALGLKAQNHGFAGRFTQAKLPMLLPVWIDGLNDRWPAGIWYRGTHEFMEPTWTMDEVHNRYSRRGRITVTDRLLRFGVLDGKGMLQVDTEIGEKQVYIGNLLVCDTPAVILELEDWRKGREKIVANNPTDAAVTVTVRPGPGFDLLGRFEKMMTIPAGGMVVFSPAER
ncbi:MAG: hypothetical protein PHR35_19400 [Kiritimatiellae bacterium]|nr:hypothetical protein [Kiritimatiellia bacterium]